MYLLYLDDSGSAANASEQHLVLGGISLFETQVNYITRALDAIARRIHPSDPHAVEFHATDIWNGRGVPWNTIKSRDQRRAIIREVLQVFADSYGRAKALACAVHKPSYEGQDPMEIGFEDLCSRFDISLGRLTRVKGGERQKGLIILDESTYETTLQNLARDFRLHGTRWNNIYHIAEVPLFVDSRASRCVQVADHVAYAVYRRYEFGDTTFLDIIINRFDYDGSVYHGLCHKAPRLVGCTCPACLSRRITHEAHA